MRIDNHSTFVTGATAAEGFDEHLGGALTDPCDQAAKLRAKNNRTTSENQTLKDYEKQCMWMNRALIEEFTPRSGNTNTNNNNNNTGNTGTTVTPPSGGNINPPVINDYDITPAEPAPVDLKPEPVLPEQDLRGLQMLRELELHN